MTNLTTIRTSAGVPFTVASPYASRFLGLLNDLTAAGYGIDPAQSGGYNYRNIAGTHTLSPHAFGRAVDVNWTDNPRGAAGKIPADLARREAAKWGMTWGGDWRNPDPMHFEIAGNAPTAAPAATASTTGAGPMPYDATGNYVSPDLIARQYRMADYLRNQPQAKSWYGVAANALGGLGGALYQNAADQALAGNQSAMADVLRNAGAAPDAATRARILTQSNIPALQEAGIKAIPTVAPPKFQKIGEEIDQFGNKRNVFGAVDSQTGQPISRYDVQPTKANGAPETTAPAELPSGDTYLATLPKPVASQIKALAEGRMAFPGGFALKSPYWQKMIQMVSQYDPSFDAVNFNARNKTRADFTSGKSAQAITSFNTAIAHLNTLDKSIAGLNNTNFPSFNAIANAAAGQYNPEFQAAMKRFQAARTAVTDELTRAFRQAGGNVHDIQEWEGTIQSADSPPALHAAVKQAIELLRGRLESLADQYNRGMGTTKDPLELLSPKAQIAVKQLTGELPSVLALPGQGASAAAKIQKPAAKQIPPEAIQELKSDPSSEAMSEFDAIFGPGSAAKVLGQ